MREELLKLAEELRTKAKKQKKDKQKKCAQAVVALNGLQKLAQLIR